MAFNPNTPLNLVLSVESVNTVLQALSAKPYEQVAGIINSIQQQAASQLEAKPETVATAEVEESNS
jgi:hypothetical protein